MEIGIELGKVGMNTNLLREESNRMQKRIRTMDDIEHDRRHRMHLEILTKEQIRYAQKVRCNWFFVMGIGVQFFLKLQ